MPFGKDIPNVTTFRNLSNFEMLKNKIESPGEKTIAIVGGGFLGSELAVALAKKGILFF
jgi:programmed cell death 8 (apoptosis-inducing factor)